MLHKTSPLTHIKLHDMLKQMSSNSDYEINKQKFHQL